jgi:3-deoxy-D-arabino-heptulosonate 7-phosphate (DAHP) synthase class II
MKTAVEWLEDEIQSDMTFMEVLGLIRQAKEMEEEQIMNAHEEGFYSPPFRMSRRKEAEQYYNETFKSE